MSEHHSSFRGAGTALVTPFTDSGALDEAAFLRFVRWQVEEGIGFLVPCGTTGENPALTADEHRRVVELTVQAAGGKVPVLAGAGSNSTARAIELAQQAIDLGADGVSPSRRTTTSRRRMGCDDTSGCRLRPSRRRLPAFR
jgi:Dihydrodipicolinate synthase/N-acetylneuraminate lyase